MPSRLVNPNYNYEPAEKDLDLTPIKESLDDLKRAVMSITGQEIVEVSNLDEITAGTRNAIPILVKQLKPLIASIAEAMPDPVKEVKVSNFPASEKHPDSVKVNNLSELGDKLAQLLKAVEGLNVNPIVNVPAPIVNIPPSEAPVVNVPPQTAPIVDIDIQALLSALKPLGLLSRDPDMPITVRMSDGRHFIDALTQTLKDNGERLATVVSTSYGLTKDEYKSARNELALPTEGYSITDKDADASPNYYGYTNQFGAWYIMKETVSAGADTYRYRKGTSGYTTAWTGRAALTYDYFYEVF